MDEACVPQTGGEPETEYPTNFKASCSIIRGAIEAVKVSTLELKCHREFSEREGPVGRHGEMQANIQLAYRHLEDARMRLGKAIQAYDGGQSCYKD
ncbi:hypothetical protein LCGC14_0390680 [marine sediment metagenome]|uniref:Uncharacterized protein n=1 Tax=marine sediment metagenome TaxID=412755 RepID=A0A0F9W8Q9_9ZZZZ